MKMKRFLGFMIFLVINNAWHSKAIDLTPPSVGFDSVAQAVSPQQVAEIVKNVMAHDGKSVLSIFLKSCAKWLPPLLIGAVMLYGGKLALEKFSEVIQNIMYAPGRVKNIDENVSVVDGKLEAHILDFNAWKDSFGEWKDGFVTRITAVESNVVNTIKKFVEDRLNAMFGKHKKEMTAVVEQQAEKTIAAVIESEKGTAKLLDGMTGQIKQLREQQEELTSQNIPGMLTDQHKVSERYLNEIKTMIVELADRLIDVPNNVEEVGTVVSHVQDKVDQIAEQHKAIMPGHQQTISTTDGSRGSFNGTGSGIFSQLVTPQLNQMRERQERLDDAMQQLLQKSLEQQPGSAKANNVINDTLLATQVTQAVEKQLAPFQKNIQLLLAKTVKEDEEKKQLQSELAQYKTWFLFLVSQINSGEKAAQAGSTFVPRDVGDSQRMFTLGKRGNNVFWW